TAFAQVRRTASTVVRRPQLFGDIRRVGAHRKCMAVVAHFRIDVEVVELRELPRQRMGVWRDLFAEQGQRWVAVPTYDVAQYLIVGAVLADQIEDVLDGRGDADAAGNRAGDWRGCRREP